MSEWIEHDGSGCPMDREAFVTVRFRDGSEDDGMEAAVWTDETLTHRLPNGRDFWRWDPISNEAHHENDIIAYRIVKPEDAA